MALNIKTFQTLVQDQAAAIQAAANRVVDFSKGAVMRALVQSNAAIGLWLESLVVRILSLTRAATSAGTDLDSWMADFGLVRLGATAATGSIAFSRYASTAAGLVPVGAQIQTADRTQTFTVIADPLNGAYSAPLGGYMLAIGVTSVAVPVQANTAGATGNVSAGTLTVIYGSVPGLDYVTNIANMAGGADAESDGAFRARFVLFLASLPSATKIAVGFAIANLKRGVNYTITEGENYAGTTTPAYFYVVVDDGTGSPPASLLAEVTAAVDAVRPLGVSFAVFAPSVVTVTVSMIITTAATYNHATVVGTVGNALSQYLNNLQLEQPLPVTKLAQIAYDASPGITAVSNVLVNGATADIAATAQQVIKPSTISVS